MKKIKKSLWIRFFIDESMIFGVYKYMVNIIHY